MTHAHASLILRLLAALALASLAGWLLAWQLWLSPPVHVPPGLLLGLILAPLLPMLPGLILGYVRIAGVWTPLMIMPYFAWGITEVVANAPERGWAIIATLLSITVFVLCLLYAALHRRPRSTR